MGTTEAGGRVVGGWVVVDGGGWWWVVVGGWWLLAARPGPHSRLLCDFGGVAGQRVPVALAVLCVFMGGWCAGCVGIGHECLGL